MYKGFWVHRGSNDLIFVVKEDPQWVIEHFGWFLHNEMVQGHKVVHDYNEEGGTIYIWPDWNRLISIEVQTKKWLQGKCADLHVKFYFDREWAENALGDAFEVKAYEKNLDGIAAYWDDKGVSHPNVVFSGSPYDEKFNTIVTDSIFKGLEVLGGYSLPENKNVYIVTAEYRAQLKEHKYK